jgi:hypothetical protein
MRTIRRVEGRHGTLTLYERPTELREVKVCQTNEPGDTVLYLTIRRFGPERLAQRQAHLDDVERKVEAKEQARKRVG